MSCVQRLSRRQFVQRTTAAVGASVALPYLVPERAFGANDRIVTGHIGVGNKGSGNLKSFLKKRDVTVAAVCDVDREKMAAAQKLVAKEGGKCAAYGDFRDLLDRKDIDAVVVTTPDHWHALHTVHACEAGKDVYCEKPLSLSIGEGRAMVNAARKHGRIVQTGSQQRSYDNFRYACELVQSGRLGKLHTVKVGIPKTNHPGDPGPDGEPPETLNYDLWLGPAPWRPYNENRIRYNFRFWWDYSGGQMTNWGAHHLDIAQWGMGTDDTGPVEIDGKAEFEPHGWCEVPMAFDVTFQYAGGVKVLAHQLADEEFRSGTTFIGSEGTIFVGRGKLESDPGEIIEKPILEGDVHLYKSDDHQQNWLDCIKSRERPICDVEIGHRSASVCHLGNIAVRTGRKIKWDPVAEQILGDEEANAMVTRSYREPWKL